MTVDAKRRRLVLAAAAAGAGPLLSTPARAQAWPARQIRIVCNFPPGGLTDLYSRAIGDHMAQSLGPLTIEAGESARLRQIHDTFGIAERPTTPDEFQRLYRTEGPQWIAIARELASRSTNGLD